jgi:hyperosmotically inducible protein
MGIKYAAIPDSFEFVSQRPPSRLPNAFDESFRTSEAPRSGGEGVRIQLACNRTSIFLFLFPGANMATLLLLLSEGKVEGRIMKKRTLWLYSLVLSTALAGSAFGYQDQDATSTRKSDTSVPADNTKVNKRDRNKGEVTAGQQSNSKADRELTRKIRQALVKDKDLSTYAHNIKVVTNNGAVTLKGPVRSEDEKKAVEAKAAEAAGGASITNQLEVAPPKHKVKDKTT